MQRNLIILRTAHSKKIEHLNEIVNHWYLFNKNDTLKEQAYRLILNILKRYQLETAWIKTSWHFAIGAGYRLHLTKSSSYYILNFTFLNLNESFTLNAGSIFGEIEYLYRPNSVFNKTVQYLRTNLRLIAYFSKNQSANQSGKYYYKEGIYDFHENLKYKVHLRNWQTFGAILKSTFPIYLGKQILMIEFGGLTGIFKHHYTIVYDYYFLRTKGYWGEFYGEKYYETFVDLKKNEVITTKRSNIEYFMLPILRIHLFLIKNSQLEITGSRNYLTIELKKWL